MLFRAKQQILICVMAFVLVGGALLFRCWPLHKKINDVECSKASQQAALAEASKAVAEMPKLKEEFAKLQADIGKYNANIPSDRQIGEFMQQIADLMNRLDLKGQLIQPGQETDAGGLKCIPVSMQCQGKLLQLFEFYKSMQGLDRLVRIDEVELENQNDYSGHVSMRTNVVVYYKPLGSRG